MQEPGQDRIAAPAKFHRLKSRVEAALLFVEQAVEQQIRGFEFIGRDVKFGGIATHRNRMRRQAGTNLILGPPAIRRSVQE